MGDTGGNSAYGGKPSPVGATTPDQPICFGDDFDIPTWIGGVAVEPLSPASTGPDAVCEPTTLPQSSKEALPLSSPETCSITVHPTLTPRDLVMIARSTFGIGRSDILVSAILIGFTTSLSHEEVAMCLKLLWLMGRESATQVQNVILLGQARHEPAGMVLAELLEWAAPYTERLL